MIHEIERLRWPGGAPGWFEREPRHRRIELMAWYRVHADPDGKRKEQGGKRKRPPSRMEARAERGR